MTLAHEQIPSTAVKPQLNIALPTARVKMRRFSVNERGVFDLCDFETLPKNSTARVVTAYEDEVHKPSKKRKPDFAIIFIAADASHLRVAYVMAELDKLFPLPADVRERVLATIRPPRKCLDCPALLAPLAPLWRKRCASCATARHYTPKRKPDHACANCDTPLPREIHPNTKYCEPCRERRLVQSRREALRRWRARKKLELAA